MSLTVSAYFSFGKYKTAKKSNANFIMLLCSLTGAHEASYKKCEISFVKYIDWIMEQEKKMDSIFVIKRYLEAGSMKSHEKLKPKFLLFKSREDMVRYFVSDGRYWNENCTVWFSEEFATFHMFELLLQL